MIHLYDVSSFVLPQQQSSSSSFVQRIRQQQQYPGQCLYVSSSVSASRKGSSSGSIAKKNKKGNSKPITLNINNLIKQLPWNIQKEKIKEQRRLGLERSVLYRQLGIVEDATYEEIVEATDALLLKHSDNMKEKIKIEITKDKILQIRLNERLAGLNSAATVREARAMSNYEDEGYVLYI